MNAVLALIARLFALFVLWTSLVFLVINVQFEIESWSVFDNLSIFFAVVLTVCSVLVVFKPRLLVKGIPVDTETATLNNLSLYHAGMVAAGMVMVYFALTDLVQAISYSLFVSQQLDGYGVEESSGIIARQNTVIVTVVFKNIFAFTVLFGAKGLAEIFYHLREAGMGNKN